MKRYFMNFLGKRLLVLALGIYCGTVLPEKELSFIFPKIDSWSLSEPFIGLLTQMFHADVFVESGAGRGGTSVVAAKYFKEVYTCETDERLYNRAVECFTSNAAVHVFQGDFWNVMGLIAQNLQNKKILFWLDGNYISQNKFERGYEPILKELAAIKKAGIADSVILVDDVSSFAPPVANQSLLVSGYPSLALLKDAILAINKDYEFYIYGDIAIAFLPDYGVHVSPWIQAMTESRLWNADSHAHYDDILNIEHKCTWCATTTEKAAVKELMIAHKGYSWSVYPLLWYGLIQLGEKNKKESVTSFAKVIGAGYKDIRLYWYSQCALQADPSQITNLHILLKKNDPWLASLKTYVDDKLKDLGGK